MVLLWWWSFKSQDSYLRHCVDLFVVIILNPIYINLMLIIPPILTFICHVLGGVARAGDRFMHRPTHPPHTSVTIQRTDDNICQCVCVCVSLLRLHTLNKSRSLVLLSPKTKMTKE